MADESSLKKSRSFCTAVPGLSFIPNSKRRRRARESLQSPSSTRLATPMGANFQTSYYGTPSMSPAAAQIAREWNEAVAIPSKLSSMEDANEEDTNEEDTNADHKEDNIGVRLDEISTVPVRQDDNDDEAPATPKMFNLDDEIPETPQPISSIRSAYSSDEEPEPRILHEAPTEKRTPPAQPMLPTPVNSSQAVSRRNRRSTIDSITSTTIDEDNKIADDDIVDEPIAAKPDTPTHPSQLASAAEHRLVSSEAPKAHPSSINITTPRKPAGVTPTVSLAGFTSPRRLRSMKKFVAPTRGVTDIPQFSSPIRQPDTPRRAPLFWSLKGTRQPPGLEENSVPRSPVTPVATLAKTRHRDEEDEASVLPPAKERRIDDVEDTYIANEGGAETPKGRGMFTTALQEHAARQQKSSPALQKMLNNRNKSPSFLDDDDDFPWAEIEALEAAQLKKKAAHDEQAQQTSPSSAPASVPALIEKDPNRTPRQSRFERGESPDMFDDDLPWDEIHSRESSPIPYTSPIMSELPDVPFASQATAALIDFFPSDTQVMSEIDSMPPIHSGQNKQGSSQRVVQTSSQHTIRTSHTHPKSSQPVVPVSSQMAGSVGTQQESTDLSFLEDYISSDVEREMVEEEYEGCFDDAETITRELEQQGPIIPGR
ncbi:hypothetical protein BZA77DRAFT_326755 [Pyronema omphalodes]|nr:hypothetical protein BZA77DRAFT_326755 [Pyronema omphalodes]